MSGVLSLKTPSNGLVTLTPVDTATNVDITVPAVNGTLNTSGAVNTVPAGTVSAPAITTTGDTNTGIFFPAADTIAFSEGGVESMRIDSAGNVGVGVVPSAWAVVKPVQVGLAALGAYLSNSYATVNTFFDGSNWKYITSDFANRYQQSSGQHQWYNAPSGIAGNTATFTQAMTLDASGNLLIRATSNFAAAPTGIGIEYTPATNYGIAIKATTTGLGTAIIFLNPSNSQVGAIDTSNTGTSFVTSSDYRLKENVQPMTGALEKVAALNPVTYNWKVDGSAGQGFIAHELQEVVPDCVTGEKDAVSTDGSPMYQGVDTSFLVATLVAAIQELTARLEAVENK